MMQVILMERVPKLGQMGEVVRVAPGYARNYLIPQKKARFATPETIREFEARRAEWAAHHAHLKTQAEQQSKTVAGMMLTILRQAGENKHLYGSVSTKDIAQGLTEQTSVTVPRAAVSLPHPIKELGIFKAHVTLHSEVLVDVWVNVAQTAEEAAAQATSQAAHLQA